MTRAPSFGRLSVAVAVAAAAAFALAAAAVGSRVGDVVAGAVWTFVLSLIVALPVLAGRQRRNAASEEGL